MAIGDSSPRFFSEKGHCQSPVDGLSGQCSDRQESVSLFGGFALKSPGFLGELTRAVDSRLKISPLLTKISNSSFERCDVISSILRNQIAASNSALPEAIQEPLHCPRFVQERARSQRIWPLTEGSAPFAERYRSRVVLLLGTWRIFATPFVPSVVWLQVHTCRWKTLRAIWETYPELLEADIAHSVDTVADLYS